VAAEEAAVASVVLPCYNEAETIAAAVSMVREYTTRDVEVIVVDDGSDATAEIVRDRWGDTRRVQVIERDRSGLASAVLRGFDAASGDILAVMDADLQHPPSALPVLLAGVEDGADMVLGSRRSESGDVADDWPLHRRIISHGATVLAWLAVPQARATTDPMTGFFAIRRECVEPVRDDLNPTGWKIALELLARCPVAEVAEAGYTFEKRQGGESSLGPREYLAYVHHLARLSVPARRGQTPSEQVVVDA